MNKFKHSSNTRIKYTKISKNFMGMSPVAGLLVSAEVFPNSLESKISDTPFHTVLSLEKTRNSMSDAAWNMFDNYFSGLIVLRDDVLKQTEGQVDIFVAPEYDGLR